MLFSADIRICADDRKFRWMTAKCAKNRLNYGWMPKTCI